MPLLFFYVDSWDVGLKKLTQNNSQTLTSGEREHFQMLGSFYFFLFEIVKVYIEQTHRPH